MADGLYVSAYLHVDRLSHAIGWWQRHDQNLSLWEKRGAEIRLVRYWELERLTGLKQHWLSLRDPEQARSLIEALLHKEGVSMSEIRGIFGTPGLDTVQSYDSGMAFPGIPYHTVCHLFSAIAISGHPIGDRQLVALALDGGPDRVVDHNVAYEAEYAVAAIVHGELKIKPVAVSPGRLWFLARERFKMREGTLMALQTASTTKFQARAASNEDLRSFASIHAYLEQVWDQIESTSPDRPEDARDWDFRFSIRENQVSMAVKVLHEVSTVIVERLLERVLSDYALDPKETVLAVSGGYALNCPTNAYLLKKFGFADFCAPPCVNDAGISLGAALFHFWKSDVRSVFSLDRADFGPGPSPNWMAALPFDAGAELEISEWDEERVVDDIIAGPIVWFDGGCEIGPRALGFRSLLGDPRRESERDFLNVVKQREWWRPVAPIVIEAEGADWFQEFRKSPFMLVTLALVDGKAAQVPAVVHLDGTARVQTANADQLPRLFRVLAAFHRRTGVPMLANTSLNDKGDPIILSPEHSLLFAARKGIRVVYISGKRFMLNEETASKIRETVSPEREFSGLGKLPPDASEAIASMNPHGVSLFALQTYCRLPILRCKFDLANRDDAIEVERLAQNLQKLRRREYGTTAHSAYLKILKEALALAA